MKHTHHRARWFAVLLVFLAVIVPPVMAANLTLGVAAAMLYGQSWTAKAAKPAEATQPTERRKRIVRPVKGGQVVFERNRAGQLVSRFYPSGV